MSITSPKCHHFWLYKPMCAFPTELLSTWSFHWQCDAASPAVTDRYRRQVEGDRRWKRCSERAVVWVWISCAALCCVALEPEAARCWRSVQLSAQQPVWQETNHHPMSETLIGLKAGQVFCSLISHGWRKVHSSHCTKSLYTCYATKSLQFLPLVLCHTHTD